MNPRSAKNEIIKISEGEYKVKITAPPVDNQANEMLVKVLANYFGVSKSKIEIKGGKTAKTKIIDVCD